MSSKIYGLLEGYDAHYLTQMMAQSPHVHLHVALHEQRIEALVNWCNFFNPDLEILVFPAWDCFPYDHNSPQAKIMGKRCEALTKLAQLKKNPPQKPVLILTIVNAISQRVLRPEILSETTLYLKRGEPLSFESLDLFLSRNGFLRVNTVREVGEFSYRGNIVDIFTSTYEDPVRLDLFGNDIEDMRFFDPLTQCSKEKIDQILVQPSGEIFLNEPTISSFKAQYKSLFGVPKAQDEFYHSLSSGIKPQGSEHFLPLFYDKMATFFDYLPEGIGISFDPDGLLTYQERCQQVQDFYQARRTQAHIDAKSQEQNVKIYNPLPIEQLYIDEKEFMRLLPEGGISEFVAVQSSEQQNEGAYRAYFFTTQRQKSFDSVFSYLKEIISKEQKLGKKIIISCVSDGSCERMMHIFKEHQISHLMKIQNAGQIQDKSLIYCTSVPLDQGFVSRDLVVFTEEDIFGYRLFRQTHKTKRKSDQFIFEIESLKVGEHIIHKEHGLGRYEGLVPVKVGEHLHDCLKLIYFDDHKLFLPVENLDMLTRYSSTTGMDQNVELDRLGSAAWQARKAKVKKKLKDMAEQLIKIAADRALKKVEPMRLDAGLLEEFEAGFAYEETQDQLSAIGDVLTDLQSGKPMDRLICGDVGFGKTEVAMRAAFMMVQNQKQVALVVPTTLLARQHYHNFKARFESFGIRVEQLSRLVSAKNVKNIKAEIEHGIVDIVIGTHALFAKNLHFKNLGLLILDEEQKFGVKQKEKLKSFGADIHVLTLSATPIPRTLQLSLTGVKELSLITTPPIDRLAIKSFLLPYDPVVLREAILREKHRNGQIYVVCPRISDLDRLEEKLRDLVPEIKLVKAHGQMAASDLEEVMTQFDDQKYDLLLATNIIESGIDIASANTLIVYRSDMFGLAQLYQLRGRIGRSKQRAYAYLTYPHDFRISQIAQQRLEILQTLDSLGAGFTLASHDMDIRGAGNILGEEQSGHIKEVGVELYQQMLKDAIAEVKMKQAVKSGDTEAAILQEEWSPQLNLGVSIIIPEIYVSDLTMRLSLYKRLTQLVEQADIDAFAVELVDRFGPMPQEVMYLLELMSIKQGCKLACVSKLESGPQGTIVTFYQNKVKQPEKLLSFIQQHIGILKLRPDHKLVYMKKWDDEAERLQGVKDFIKMLAEFTA